MSSHTSATYILRSHTSANIKSICHQSPTRYFEFIHFSAELIIIYSLRRLLMVFKSVCVQLRKCHIAMVEWLLYFIIGEEVLVLCLHKRTTVTEETGRARTIATHMNNSAILFRLASHLNWMELMKWPKIGIYHECWVRYAALVPESNQPYSVLW